MTSEEARQQLVDALRLDLIGPRDVLGSPDEILPQRPSSWYLTGFLVPLDADESQRVEETSGEEIDEVDDTAGLDDATPPEPASARQKYLPSSIGLSVLVPCGHKPTSGDSALGGLSLQATGGRARHRPRVATKRP